MVTKPNNPDKLQICLTSSVESIRASLEPYAGWIEQMLDAPLRETLTLEVDCNPGDAVAEELLQGLPVVSATKARNSNWRTVIEDWELPPGVSPRIALSLQRERKPNAAPIPVWELDWQDCPVAFRLRGLVRHVISVKIPTLFPPADLPMLSSAQHWFIVRREDAAKVLVLKQQVQDQTERYLETAHGQARLQGRYDWDAVVLDSTTRRMVRTDFELFFEREDWFRKHNLPYRRGYLLWTSGQRQDGDPAGHGGASAHPGLRARLERHGREERRCSPSVRESCREHTRIGDTGRPRPCFPD
jgi:hypothetical protein